MYMIGVFALASLLGIYHLFEYTRDYKIEPPWLASISLVQMFQTAVQIVTVQRSKHPCLQHMPSKKLPKNHYTFGALLCDSYIQLGEQSSHISRLSIEHSNIQNMSPHMHVCGQDF
jgi:hypothetical protein